MLDTVPFEFLGQLGSALGSALTQRRRRADHGQGDHPPGAARRKGAGDGPADLGADEVKTLDAQRIHQPHEIVDDDVECPRKFARHRCRAAKTAHVRADDAEAAREAGHPAKPRRSAFGIAVEQQDRLRLAPRVGKVVDEVVELPVRRTLECRHHGSSLAADFAPGDRPRGEDGALFYPGWKVRVRAATPAATLRPVLPSMLSG